MLDDTLDFTDAFKTEAVEPKTSLSQIRRSQKVEVYQEYRVYFAIIFLTLLPIASAVSLGTLLASRGKTWRNPIACALGQTRCMAPLIFTA
ncbi:MAG: cytochrome PufQ [Pseudomonadota bacterium]